MTTEDNPFEGFNDPIVDEAPKSDAPKADDSKTEAPKAVARRTKAEKLADDIEEAKALLSENGYRVLSEGEDDLSDDAGDDAFASVPSESYPLSAVVGQVAATVTNRMVAIPVLRMALVGWVGPETLEIPARNAEDIIQVIQELRKQALSTAAPKEA